MQVANGDEPTSRVGPSAGTENDSSTLLSEVTVTVDPPGHEDSSRIWKRRVFGQRAGEVRLHAESSEKYLSFGVAETACGLGWNHSLLVAGHRFHGNPGLSGNVRSRGFAHGHRLRPGSDLRAHGPGQVPSEPVQEREGKAPVQAFSVSETPAVRVTTSMEAPAAKLSVTKTTKLVVVLQTSFLELNWQEDCVQELLSRCTRPATPCKLERNGGEVSTKSRNSMLFLWLFTLSPLVSVRALTLCSAYNLYAAGLGCWARRSSVRWPRLRACEERNQPVSPWVQVGAVRRSLEQNTSPWVVGTPQESSTRQL